MKDLVKRLVMQQTEKNIIYSYTGIPEPERHHFQVLN